MTRDTSSPAEIRLTLDFTVDPLSSPCACMGPQGDEPLCPCAMRNVIRWRGRWVKMSIVGNDAPAPDSLDGVSPEREIPRDWTGGGGKLIFDVVLTDYDNKVGIIKAIRQLFGLGLFEAKAMVDRGTPLKIKGDVSEWEAERIKTAIEAEGGTVQIK